MRTPDTYQSHSLWEILLLAEEQPHLEASFSLRCFQRFSVPSIAIQQCSWRNNWYYQRLVQLGPLVLESALLKLLTVAVDRDRTVSRRSEPNSRPALIGEQPNPWDLLQPQDATSRHRGAKRERRYGRLVPISLLSPE
jgi:hypothetical protein